MAERPLRISLYTYSTRPRGGVVHSLELGQALVELGHDVRLYALEKPGRRGFFRETNVPSTFIPVEEIPGESMDDRIQRYIEAYVAFLERDLRGGDGVDIHHAEDCISANALVRLRDSGLVPAIVRTIHHVDDFTSPALIHCQLASILEPDVRFVVSEWWHRRLADEYGVNAAVVHNGVDLRRFVPPANDGARLAERQHLGFDGRVVVLAVGGVEPRKNTLVLLEAFSRIRDELGERTGRPPLLLIAGGETLFDYRSYRDEFERVLSGMVESGSMPAGAVRVAGSVSDDDLAAFYRTADVLAFPSVKEGWGLVVLEAQASGTPVVASDIEVLREYLEDGRNALLVAPDDPGALARALVRAATDGSLAARLRRNGLETAQEFGWRASAERHIAVYRDLLERGVSRTAAGDLR